MRVSGIDAFPVFGLPEISDGDNLAQMLGDALAIVGLQDGDIVAVAQKIVSKAEGRTVALGSVIPSKRALELAALTLKDPRFVELVLCEASEVLRALPQVLIVANKRGHVMANAGIDRSNVPGLDHVLLLPEDPDASALAIRSALTARFDVNIGVIITDSFGRAWRRGIVGVAIGASGVVTLADARGRLDRDGTPLAVTEIAEADALAAIAVLVMGEAAEGTPCSVIRGWRPAPDAQGLGDLLRSRQEDLFR